MSSWSLKRSFGGGVCWICAFGHLRFLTGVCGEDEKAVRTPAIFNLTGEAGAVVLGGGRYGLDGLRMPLAPLVVTIVMVAMSVDRKVFWMIRGFVVDTLDRSLKLPDPSCKNENLTSEVVMRLAYARSKLLLMPDQNNRCAESCRLIKES